MPKGDQDHGRVAMTIAARFAGRGHQGFDLGGRQIFLGADNWGIYDGWRGTVGDPETHDNPPCRKMD
jgi:hypothetical protein